MIAVIFALPDESKGFLPLLDHCGAAAGPDEPIYLGNLAGKEVLVLHTGMGRARAEKAVRSLLERWPVTHLISSGFAGGLDPAIPSGCVVLATNDTDPQWRDAVASAIDGAVCQGRFHTASAVVETLAARAALAKETGAIAVEMEGEPIARIAREKALPFLALRVISDSAQEELAVPFSVCFDAETERPRVGALLAFLVTHPDRIGGFFRFVFGMKKLRATLGEALAVAISN